MILNDAFWLVATGTNGCLHPHCSLYARWAGWAWARSLYVFFFLFSMCDWDLKRAGLGFEFLSLCVVVQTPRRPLDVTLRSQLAGTP